MNNYQHNMTLDEIAENDVEMAKDAIKNAKRYTFGRNRQRAMYFIKECVDITLKRCGVNVDVPRGDAAKKMYEKVLNKQFEDKKLKLESRNAYHGHDVWKRGIYIYKDDVLVSFISNVLSAEREEVSRETMRLVKTAQSEYFVITNAKTDLIQTSFLSPGSIIIQ